MQQQDFMPKWNAKYNAARWTLLAIFALSLLNQVMMFFDTYFLFSSWISTQIGAVGALIYFETGELGGIPIVLAIVGVVVAVPYLLAFLFSKKHIGWMIAALVLFSIDTVWFLYDFILFLVAGEMSFLMDFVIRVIALVTIILGVVYGVRARRAAAAAWAQEQAAMQQGAPVAPSQSAPVEGVAMAEGEQAAVEEEQAAVEGEQAPASEPAFAPLTRTVTVTRKKSFVGCAVKFNVYVNGKQVASLKNGETVALTVPTQEVRLGVMMGAVSAEEVKVEPGMSDATYQTYVTMGFTSGNVHIDRIG